jgi:molecular chaperone GrpE
MTSRTAFRRIASVVSPRIFAVHQRTAGTPISQASVLEPRVWTSTSANARWFSDASKAAAEDPLKSEDEPKQPAAENQKTEAKKDEPGAEEESSPPQIPTPPSKEEVLEAQVKELKEKVLRSLAEQDNTRRIAKVDVDKARQFAIKSFAKSLLDVADNLERAMKAVPVDQLDKKKDPVLCNLYEGIELTEKGLTKAFEANGLIKFGQVGEVFDPNRHEALFEYPDATKTAGTVGQIMKPGFLLNRQVLRPAEVGVVKKE